MKKTVAWLLALILIIAIVIVSQNQNSPSISQNSLPVTANPNQVELDVNNQKILAAWFKTNAKNISLYPNFTENLTASQAVVKYSCKSLSNGGFYSKENKPLGLFISNNKTTQNFISSSLFNGFFVINNNTPLISNEIPENPDTALQTGPIIYQNSLPSKLKITSDKYSRRVVAAINDKNEVIFIVFYDPNSVFNGPYLGDLPDALKQFSVKQKENIISAINLDGGAASTFATDEFFLNELSPVGSFFCIS
jgi:uncharacterized protein YigE (DUF2233 family)